MSLTPSRVSTGLNPPLLTPAARPHDADGAARKHAARVGAPLRLAIFTSSVAIGGMEKHAELLARDLARLGVEVYTICPRWEPIEPWAQTFLDVGVAGERLTPDRRYGLATAAREAVRLSRQLRAWRIQALHIHLTGYEGGFWALLAARLAGVRAVVISEHLAPECALPPTRRLRRDLITRGASALISVSQKNYLARSRRLYTPPARTFVIPNGVDLGAFPPTPPDRLRALRRELGVPDRAPLIGSAVRLVEEKGIGNLLDALPRVLAEAPDAYLLLVGDGPLRGELERQATALGVRERVVFAGFQPDPRPYLDLMNAFTLPVPFGSASIGLLEAMAMRRAVVITFGGEGEAVVDGESGLCPPPRDPAALADALLRILRDPAFERRLGENARRRVEHLYSSERVARQALAIYLRELGRLQAD